MFRVWFQYLSEIDCIMEPLVQVYVYMHVRIFTCMYVYVRACMCMYVYALVCTCTYVYVCIYKCVYVDVNIRTCVYLCVHICTGMCYCRSPKINETQILPVNPSIYHSEMIKNRKMLGNASISGFYQTMSVNAGICRHLLVKVRFVWLSLCFVSVCVCVCVCVF